MSYINSDQFWSQVFARLWSGDSRIKVPISFHQRMKKIDELLSNDYTGIIKTILDFMISTASVPFSFATDNPNLSKSLQDWSVHELNKDMSIDIPKGLRALSTQYFQERWKSSFIVLNIDGWKNVNGLILPTSMWFSDGGSIIVESDSDELNKKKYFLADKDHRIRSTDEKAVLIRKPFNSWYDDYPTPYLVGRGVLYNAMLKRALISKQADVIEEIIPYILMVRAGDANLMKQSMMGDLEKNLTDIKESLKTAKRDQKYRSEAGDMILKGRYDLQLDHLIPDLTKLFSDTIVKPVNFDILAGLGLIELVGFSSDRQEAILNPKVLVEEISNGVADLKALLEEVLDLIIEKNTELHPKHVKQDIRLIPGVAKAFLTDNMRKLIKDYTNTGLISIEDAFQGLPQGFDFEISKKRRQQEAENGDEELFFPRILINQDSNSVPDLPPREPTPYEIPKKKVKKEAKEVTNQEDTNT
jgi:hypothetical protein